MKDQENLFELDITVQLRQAGNYSGSLQIAERVHLQAGSFLELCTILGRFHEVACQLAVTSEQAARVGE